MHLQQFLNRGGRLKYFRERGGKRVLTVAYGIIHNDETNRSIIRYGASMWVADDTETVFNKALKQLNVEQAMGRFNTAPIMVDDPVTLWVESRIPRVLADDLRTSFIRQCVIQHGCYEKDAEKGKAVEMLLALRGADAPASA